MVKVYTRLKVNPTFSASNSTELQDFGFFSSELNRGGVTYRVTFKLDGKMLKVENGTFNKKGESIDHWTDVNSNTFEKAAARISAYWEIFLDKDDRIWQKLAEKLFPNDKDTVTKLANSSSYIKADEYWSIANIAMSKAHTALHKKDGKTNQAIVKITKGCSPKINSTLRSERSPARKEALMKTLEGNTCPFSIIDQYNHGAKFDKNLWVELHHQHRVGDYEKYIVKSASIWSVDPDLLRAIMYMETTHGYYDEGFSLLADAIPNQKIKRTLHKSVLPMNINYAYWGSFFGTREQLKDPEFNIMQGAKMFSFLEKHLDDNYSVSKIATLYNDHAEIHVTEYGARVNSIYKEKPWLNPATDPNDKYFELGP